MAVNVCDIFYDSCRETCRSNCSTPRRLMKLDFSTDDSSPTTMLGNSKKRNVESPYLNEDKLHLLSRMAEKRVTHKISPNFVSSFTLAANVYKTNSDEFKSRKRYNKKIKKSVLTLTNKSTLMPQECTVSDMNESEYCIREDDNRKLKSKKRFSVKKSRKAREENKMFEVYDRDARYCSQLNIDLDCSSTEMIKHFKGDGMKISKKKNVSQEPEKEYSAHNIWAMLRNINRFQYIASPPISECSIKSLKKKRTFTKRCPKRKNARYVETCRTKEFAYVRSIDVGKSTSVSRNSSFDRITVIEKQDSMDEICRNSTKKRVRALNITKEKNNNQTSSQARHIKKNKQVLKLNNYKAIEYKENTDSNSALSVRENNSANCDRDSVINYDSEFTDNLNNFLNLGSRDQSLNNSEGNDNVKETCNITNLIQTKSGNVSSDRAIYSNSSKIGFGGSIKLRKDKDMSTFDSDYQVSGITKVILSKDQDDLVLSRPDLPLRKRRLVTTMPSTAVMPKLTRTEIKRRLSNIKFPLIILGKDQLSSTIEVFNYHPPQFDGLDRNIWPFMLDWSKTNVYQENKKSYKGNTTHADIFKNSQYSKWPIERRANKFIRESEEKVRHNFKDKKPAKAIIFTNKKGDQTGVEEITTLQSTKRSKQMSKRSILSITNNKENINERRDAQHSNDVKNTKQSKTIGKYIDVSTETDTKINHMSERLKIVETENDRLATTKYRRGRAKWASNFIENVIRKIKNGVYYTQENKGSHIKLCDVRENFTQSIAIVSLKNKQECTECYSDYNISLSNSCTPKLKGNEENDLLKNIGFDETFCELEVETLNLKQIAIRHCLTNVIVQFDVNVPAEPNYVLVNVKQAFTCIPIPVNEKPSKTFKCTTAILNAVLPAELCSLLPKMMQTIINVDKTIILPITAPEKPSLLSTISEISRREESPDSCMLLSLPLIGMSLEMRLLLLDGEFCKTATKQYLSKCMNVKSALRVIREYKVMNKFNTHLIWRCIINPKSLDLTLTKATYSDMLRSNELAHLKKLHRPSQSTALVPYIAPINFVVVKNRKLISTFKEQFCKYIINLPWYINLFQTNCVKYGTADSLIRGKDWGLVNKYFPNAKNSLVKVNSLYKGDYHQGVIVSEVVRITKTDKYPQKITKYANNREKQLESQLGIIYKTKRRQFVKLHKKYKSTSNIQREKCYIPLNKITNIEDFCQVLGGKQLISVFNGDIGQKILSTLEQMKKWVSEISSTQALLIVLLINKKDTSNLVRFRHILLQGIAVNRITRAVELDMEIEVIEREQFNELPQYEGISYLPASVENQNSLLEELHWIAKTTASDYQKPFDESSEKLLKALLEKRKKLNPSYLRVMARYVGLGLLKPLKNNKYHQRQLYA